MIKIPPLTALSGLLVVLPFFFALDLPLWLGWLAVAIQAVGFGLEVLAEIQLMRANSFAVSAQAATTVQRKGMYRWLENPIYVGILMQIVGWAIWMPLVAVAIVLFFFVVRGMVAGERQFLNSRHNTIHRGIDSFLWN